MNADSYPYQIGIVEAKHETGRLDLFQSTKSAMKNKLYTFFDFEQEFTNKKRSP